LGDVEQLNQFCQTDFEKSIPKEYIQTSPGNNRKDVKRCDNLPDDQMVANTAATVEDNESKEVALAKLKIQSLEIQKRRKDDELKSLKLSILNHDAEVLKNENNKLKSALKNSGFDVENKSRAKEIDKIFEHTVQSQKIRHEKEIKELNLQLQTQITLSQELNVKEKSLFEKLDLLQVDKVKKDSVIQNLTNQVHSLQLKLSQDSGKSGRDDKCKEIRDMRERFEELKRVSEENTIEKDRIISCLEKELESVKAEVESNVVKIKTCSREKVGYKNTICQMKRKFSRSLEIISLMKNALAGLTAMHEETSDKLIDAIRNTAHANQQVIWDVKEQLKGFEKEMGWVRVGSEEDNNNHAIVKNEVVDSPGTSKNAKLVAEDLTKEFGMHFKKKNYDKIIVATAGKVCEEDSGRRSGNSGRSYNRKRKSNE